VPTFVRVIVILLAVAGAAGHLTFLDAVWWHSLGITATVSRDVGTATVVLLSAHALVSVTCSVFAVTLVLSERHRQDAARALGLALGAWSYLMAYSGITLLFRPLVPGIQRDAFEAHFLAVEVLGLVGVLRYTAIFPRPLREDELAPLDTLPRVLLPFHEAALRLRRPFAPLLAGAVVLTALWGVTVATRGELGDAGLSRGMDLVRFSAAGFAVMHLRRAWACATEGDRDGLQWLLVAVAVLLASLGILISGNVLVAVTGFPEPHVAWRPILVDVGLVGFMASLAMSALHREGHDPGRVLRVVATKGAIASIGLFLAAGLEALFSGGVLAAASVRHGVGSALAFAIVLSTQRQLSEWISRTLNL
jgi:hypothetical protein